jgi:hypothetical protein
LIDQFSLMNIGTMKLVKSICLEASLFVVARGGVFGDLLGVLAGGVNAVGIESDPEQSRQTAALIPTLPPVNLAEMVILWEELNCRLSRSDAFAKREEGHFSCFISANQMKDAKH